MAKKPAKVVANTKAPASSYAVVKMVGNTMMRKYPVDTMARARNAIARVGQHGTPAEKTAVYNKVKAKYPALAKRSTVIPTKGGKRAKG
jgi:hypothetical protein